MAAKEFNMMVAKGHTFTTRRLAGALLFAAAVLAPGMAQAAVELIPSIGVTKSTDENAADAKAFGGLAVRAALLPFLMAEGGIAYRQDSFAGGDLAVRQWPVTASLWATPLPAIYLGGGVGWYRTTLEWSDDSLFDDETTSKMGVHLGGGARVPMSPRLGLDLQGRYIFMQKDDDNLEVPTEFDPDFWSTSLGLAITF